MAVLAHWDGQDQASEPMLPFQLEIEFSEMDTDRRMDLISIVTYAASTFLDIRTTGENQQGIKQDIVDRVQAIRGNF